MDATPTFAGAAQPSTSALPGLQPPGSLWPSVEQPSGPRVVTISERQVYIPNEDISLYALARKWIQNLPEEEQHPPEQPPIQLPALPPANPQAEQLTPPPEYVDTYTQQDYEPEDALRKLKTHWVQVRQHFQTAQTAKDARQQQRLLPWLQAALAANGRGPQQ